MKRLSGIYLNTLSENFENILESIKNQDTFDEVFYDDDGNEYSCRSYNLTETEFYYVDIEDNDSAKIVDNKSINSVEDIENIFKSLAEECEQGFVIEGYVGDITTDDDILEDLYYDIMDYVSYNETVPFMRKDGNEWSYIIDTKNDKIIVDVYNEQDDINSSNEYTIDEFSELELQDFIDEVTELCYYAY